MNQLSDITTIKSVMSRHKVHLSKSLGQNFLVNPDVCPQMAAECGVGKGIGVLEVGPGIGVLTAELAARAEKVVSVDLDRHLLPVLSETLAGFSNIKIVYGDILKIDIRQLIADEFDGMEVVVCANLPYYITSPVIMRFLEERLPVSAVTVMVQKEAATRLCALPGTRACGAVSAAVHYYSEPQILFGVDRTSFLPQPKVDSAVIRLDVRKEPCIQINSEKNFFALVKAAFGQRRKTVLNAVSAGLPFTREEVALALDHTEIPQNSRAEQLSMEQLASFSNELYSDI